MRVLGDMPIVITRRYDSKSNYDSPLGYGWSFVHDRQLYEYPDGLIIVRYGSGTRDQYTPSGGTYVSPVGGMQGTLVHNIDGSWELRYLNGTRDHFDSTGRLTAYFEPSGSSHEYTYDAGGKLALTGTSEASATPGVPQVVAYNYRLTRIDERGANGVLTGRYITFAYNGTTGRLSSATTNDGRVVTYQHDVIGSLTKGNLIQVNGLAGVVRSYVYADANDEHNLTSIIEAIGRTPIVNTYDDQDRVTRQEEGTRRIDFNYQVPLTRTVVTRTIRDQNGLNPYTSVTTYDFDTRGRITKVTDALGHEQRFTYSNAKLVIKEIWQKAGATLSLLQSRQYAYDTAGKRLSESITLDSGEVITYTWTYDHHLVATSQVVSSAAPSRIFRTEYEFFYDALGRPTRIKTIKKRKDDGSFQSTGYTYDSRNRLLTTTLPDGVKVVNEYTGDFVTEIYFEVGGVQIPQRTKRFDYDAAGNRTKEWDARNNLTEFTFDDRRRPLTITNPLGESTILTYDGDRLTTVERGATVSDGEGQVTRNIFDSRGRVTAIQRKDDGGSFQTFLTYELDSESQKVSISDALNRKTTFIYDVLGRLTSTTDPLSKTTQMAYNAVGLRTAVTDASGRQTTFEFDDLNRVTAVVRLGVTPNPRTELTHDALGNVLSVRNAENNVTEYEYDALSRLTEIRQPLGQTFQQVYDSRGRVDYMVNARGNKVDFAYEPWGSVKEEKQYASTSAPTPDRTISYSYDDDGNLTSVLDDGVQPGAIYTITHDQLSRVHDETIKYLPGGDRVLNRRYDRFGNREELTLQDGGAISNLYSYNKLDRLDSASLAGASIGLSYFATDEMQAMTLPGGVTRNFAYRANGPIEEIEVTGPGGGLAEYAFTYDNTLNVDTLTDPDGVHDFDYDGLDRLTSTSRPSGLGLSNESYGYDRIGNREDGANAALYSYDSNGRITASPGLTYTFDPDGNTVTRSDGAALTHNPRNRLIEYSKGGTTAEYLQDPFGRRIRKIVNGVSTFYLWDGGQLLAEYSALGVREKRYAYVDSSATPVQVTDSNGAYYVHADHLGAPRLLTNSSAQIVWKARYQAFGSAVVDEDPDGNSVPIVFNARLPGQYFDTESGLHYNYYRDYDPAIGRYVQSDPLGLRGGLNLYSYAASNPLNGVDTKGLEVSMICRPIQDKRVAWLGIKHCFVIIWHWEYEECSRTKVIDAQYSIAGGRTPQEPGQETYDTDREAAEDHYNSDDVVHDIPPPPGVSQEDFENNVKSSGDNYYSSEPYDATTGPNSNTAADNIIEGAGGVAPDTPGAYLQQYGDSPTFGEAFSEAQQWMFP